MTAGATEKGESLGLGRIVHLNIGIPDAKWRPGIIVDVEGNVAMCEVFLAPSDRPYPAGSRLFLDNDRVYVVLNAANEGKEIGCWRWPPRS